MDRTSIENVLATFRKELTLTITQLTSMMDCSTITVRRHLKSWGAYTSYNMNGCYYVLPDIPTFDAHGLWENDGIRFSKHGNLKQTIIHFVQNGSEGLDASTISERLGFNAHSLLPRLIRKKTLQREKIEGRFVYYSSKLEIYEKQTKERKTRIEKSRSILADAIAVLVLVEKIKYPELDLPQLAKKLKKRGIAVELHTVRNFFQHHGLLKKKANSASF